MEIEDPHFSHNRNVFAAFCESNQNFLSMRDLAIYPGQSEQFPDVKVPMPDGTTVFWEIGEWLHQDQMQASMHLKQVREKIETALSGISNNYRNILHCTLLLKRDPGKFSNSDSENFRNEFIELVGDENQVPVLGGGSKSPHEFYS